MKTGKSSLSAKYGQMFEDVDAINAYSTEMAADCHYDSRVIEQLVSSNSQQSFSDLVLFNEYDVFQLFLKFKRTSGYDHLPYWLLC